MSYPITTEELLEEAGICSCCGNTKCGTNVDHMRQRMRIKLEYARQRKEAAIAAEKKRMATRKKNAKHKQKKREDLAVKKFTEKLNRPPQITTKIKLNPDVFKAIAFASTSMNSKQNTLTITSTANTLNTTNSTDISLDIPYISSNPPTQSMSTTAEITPTI